MEKKQRKHITFHRGMQACSDYNKMIVYKEYLRREHEANKALIDEICSRTESAINEVTADVLLSMLRTKELAYYRSFGQWKPTDGEGLDFLKATASIGTKFKTKDNKLYKLKTI